LLCSLNIEDFQAHEEESEEKKDNETESEETESEVENVELELSPDEKVIKFAHSLDKNDKSLYYVAEHNHRLH
jgi:hypothetical protein